MCKPHGWIAMQQHYFLSAWIPEDSQLTYHYYSHMISSQNGGQNIYVVGFVSPEMNIAPRETASSHAIVYVGPGANAFNRLATSGPT